MKRLQSFLSQFTLLASSAVVVLILSGILYDLFSRGLPYVSWEFLTTPPSAGMTRGGILPAMMGTVVLTLLTAIIAIPVGVACAIYLQEYAAPSVLTGLIRASIRNLAGIPSIIFGLFGLALFVQGLHLGTSMLSAGLTLGLLSLPYIITTTEEALKRIPQSLREGTLALGVTRFEMIRDVVLPQALPGITTGVILAISRAAGETAPILFTGVAFYINQVPDSLHQEFMALPYHIYVLATQHMAMEEVRPLAYASTVVLIGLVFILNMAAFIIRHLYRSQE